MAIHPFRIDISTAVLEDLWSRLAATRWPEGLRDPGWNDGTSEVYLKELLQHWQHGFDWRAQEQAINRFAQFRTEVHGADTIQQCLNAGLLDEIHIDIAAVFLGSGIRLFDHLAGTPIVLGNPTVIQGIGVTHLRYPVRTK